MAELSIMEHPVLGTDLNTTHWICHFLFFIKKTEKVHVIVTVLQIRKLGLKVIQLKAVQLELEIRFI